MLDFWPFIQSNQTYTCVNEVMANSPRNLFKLSAFQRGMHIMVVLGTILFIQW